MRKSLLLLPFIIAAALYAQTLHFLVFSDDRILFEEYQLQQHGNLLREAFAHPLVFNDSYYRPVPLWMTLVAAHTDPGYTVNHALCVVIFELDILLVFLASLMLLGKCYPGTKQAITLSALASLVYAVHPANVETVAFTPSIYDLSMTLFVLAGLCIDLRARDNALRWAGLSLCFLLACLSKESAIVFLPVLFLFRLMTDGIHIDALKKNYRAALAIIAAGIVYLAIRQHVLGNALMQSQSMNTIGSLYLHFVFVCKTVGLYLERIFTPFLMHGVFHTVSMNRPLVDTDYVLGLIAIFSPLFLLLLKQYRAAIAALVFLCALFPVSNVVVIQSTFSDINDRYLALPLALLLIAAAAVLYQVIDAAGRATKMALSCIVLAYLFALVINTVNIVPHYRDSESYWLWASDAHPDIPAIRLNLVNELYRQKRYPEASLQLEKIREHNRTFFVLVYLGRLDLLTHHDDSAERRFTQSLDLAKNPDEYSSGLSYIALSQLVQDNTKDYQSLLDKAGTENPLSQLVNYFSHCRADGSYTATDRARVHDLNPQVLQEFNEVIGINYPRCTL